MPADCPPVMVVKFGGSSVATPTLLARVASRIRSFCQDGWRVAAVVSAMGRTTDKLLELADTASPHGRDEREVDQLLATGEIQSVALLALALRAQGVMARSLTAGQCGICAAGRHGRALITSFDAQSVRQTLDEGAVAVVAGFQALDSRGDVMTLGRGGSDLTAIALAAALDARVCSIYTDVGGLYSADPKIVPDAHKIPQMDVSLCCELSHAGSRVLQARCVELAARLNVPVYLASSFDETEGSWIMKDVNERSGIAALAHETGWAEAVFSRTEKTWNLLSSLDDQGASPLDFAVTETRLTVWFKQGDKAVDDAWRRWNLTPLAVTRGLVSLSLIGSGIGNHPETARALTQLLIDQKTPPRRLTTSGNRLTCLVATDRIDELLNAVHRRFLCE
ncbi:aspartate kinase [Jonquetella anthropi]|uniref:aspartate kinase n=1 Tax=Jonquetella anthropi TaxID=428712 RepID=UPI0023F328B7|nr:aspartate kinase [Jonquetella anthropi]